MIRSPWPVERVYKFTASAYILLCLDLFIYGFYNDAVSSSDCTTSNCGTINESFGREWSLPILKHYPGISLEELRKTMKSLSQHNRSPSRLMNRLEGSGHCLF
jgi:hypothetical protein